MITYHKGDATKPILGPGQNIIAHIVNDQGGWGRGFVLALGRAYPRAEAAYRRWYANGATARSRFQLGAVQCVQVGEGRDLKVCNMLAQRGYRAPSNPRPLDYRALEQCLHELAHARPGTRFHMPRIGCGLAGGDWGHVSRFLDKYLGDFEVYVYDL